MAARGGWWDNGSGMRWSFKSSQTNMTGGASPEALWFAFSAEGIILMMMMMMIMMMMIIISVFL